MISNKTTLDKPEFSKELNGMNFIDVKINSLGNRVALSSFDYNLSVYNLHPESGLTYYKDMNR